jgi:hypothetical protein
MGKPQALLPADGFSARFTKTAYFNTGIYQINTHADDGIRVYVDGDLKIDEWKDAGPDQTANVVLGAGVHTITVEYYDNILGATRKVDIINATSQNAKLVSSFDLPIYRSFDELSDYRKHLVFYNASYTRYAELGYGDSVYLLSVNQYGAQIMLKDGRVGWVQKDYLVDNVANDYWLVKAKANKKQCLIRRYCYRICYCRIKGSCPSTYKDNRFILYRLVLYSNGFRCSWIWGATATATSTSPD